MAALATTRSRIILKALGQPPICLHSLSRETRRKEEKDAETRAERRQNPGTPTLPHTCDSCTRVYYAP